MKKRLFGIISVILCLSMLFGFSAQAQQSGVSRVSAVVCGDSSTSKGLCWYTDTNGKSQLSVYKNGVDVTALLSVTHTVSEWEGSFVQKAYITGLEPGSDYTYSIDSVTGSFVTDDGNDSFDFVVVGDVQASSRGNFESAARVVGKAFETMPTAEFYATLGDFTNDSTNEEWDLYGETFSAINTSSTLVPIAGNHDSADGWFNNMFALDTSESVQTKNGVNYSFEYGNVHFSVVNNNDLFAITNAQLKWLENDLNSTSCDFKIVMMHKSPYSMGKDIKWPDAQYLGEELTAVCDAAGVDIVFSGHDHMYLRTKPLCGNAVTTQSYGTTYILAGTPGTKRYEFRNFNAGNFLSTELIDVAISQKNGYGNYFDGEDFDSADAKNIGGLFNTVSVRGGTLTVTSYVLSDDSDTLTQVDTYTITKEQGKNTPSFSGDNTTSESEYNVGKLASAVKLLSFIFTKWLPKFFMAIPDMLEEYLKTGTF